MKFLTSRVVTVYTGYCMGTGIGCAQDVFDCLYPGIMTIGCAAMQPNAAKELERQFPALRNIAPVVDDGKDYARFLRDAVAVFGEDMDVSGPAKTTDAEIKQAFDDFGRQPTTDAPGKDGGK